MRRFFNCSCYGEGVMVESDDTTIDLATWHIGFHRTPFSIKARHILNIIRKGTPYTDMVVLLPDEAEQLGKWLIEEANRIKKKEASHGTGGEATVHDSGAG